MTEPKESREVKCAEFMHQSIYVASDLTTATKEVFMVSVEGSRCSLDLSKAEAIDLAAALVWAANGGRPG